jgi:hypothetical protein
LVEDRINVSLKKHTDSIPLVSQLNVREKITMMLLEKAAVGSILKLILRIMKEID